MFTTQLKYKRQFKEACDMKGGTPGEEVFILDVAGFLDLTVNT